MADVHLFPTASNNERTADEKSQRSAQVVDMPKPTVRTNSLAQAEVQTKLQAARKRHRELDATIEDLKHAGPLHRVEMQRLKKEKLLLRDAIRALQAQLLPDIIA